MSGGAHQVAGAADIPDAPPPPYTLLPGEEEGLAPPRTIMAPAANHAQLSPDDQSLSALHSGDLLTYSELPSLQYPSALPYFAHRICTSPRSDIFHYQIRLHKHTKRSHLTLEYQPELAKAFKTRDVRSEDYNTFIEFLFSPLSQDAKLARIDSDPGRRFRMEAIAKEWNEGFFGLRGIRMEILFKYNEVPTFYTNLIPNLPSRPGTARSQALLSSQSSPLRLGSDTPAWMQRRNIEIEQERQQGQHHQMLPVRRRSLSAASSIVSTSATSSSSSSNSSLSFETLEVNSVTEFQQIVASLRVALASGTPAKVILSKLVMNLYDKRKSGTATSGKTGSKAGAKEIKAELHGSKREMKAEYKSFLRELKAVRKNEKRARKEEKKFRRSERKNERRARKRGVAAGQVGNWETGSRSQSYNYDGQREGKVELTASELNQRERARHPVEQNQQYSYNGTEHVNRRTAQRSTHSSIRMQEEQEARESRDAAASPRRPIE